MTAGRQLSTWLYQLVEDDAAADSQSAAARPRSSAGPRPAGEPGPCAGPRHRGSHRVHGALARGPPRPSVRDRRRRGQGGPLRPAGAPGHGQPCPALGDRLQVPTGAGRDGRRGHRRVRGADRDAHAGRASRAREGRGVDGRPGHAPQPRRSPAQGHPDRRHRRPPEGRRCHPGGRPADPRQAPIGRPRVPGPDHLPGVRHARRAGRGRGPPLLPEPGLPGAPVPGVRALRGPGWDGHRGGRVGCPDPAPRAGHGPPPRGLLLPHGGAARDARALRSQERGEPARVHRAGAGRPAVREGAQQPGDPAGGGVHGGGPRPLARPTRPARRIWTGGRGSHDRRGPRPMVRGGRGGAATDRGR